MVTVDVNDREIVVVARIPLPRGILQQFFRVK
jgi:hypothetical protein